MTILFMEGTCRISRRFSNLINKKNLEFLELYITK